MAIDPNNTSTNPLPAATLAMIRVALVAIAGFMAGKGWISSANVNGTVEMALQVIGVAAAAYGIWKTFRRQQQIKNAETMVGGRVLP